MPGPAARMVSPEDYYAIWIQVFEDDDAPQERVSWRDARKIFDPERYYEFCRASFEHWTAGHGF